MPERGGEVGDADDEGSERRAAWGGRRRARHQGTVALAQDEAGVAGHGAAEVAVAGGAGGEDAEGGREEGSVGLGPEGVDRLRPYADRRARRCGGGAAIDWGQEGGDEEDEQRRHYDRAAHLRRRRLALGEEVKKGGGI